MGYSGGKGMDKEKILENLLGFHNKKVIRELFNFYKEMEGIKKDMVDVLNLLDETAKNLKEKDIMRNKILDSYNELPRKTLRLIDDLIIILKE